MDPSALAVDPALLKVFVKNREYVDDADILISMSNPTPVIDDRFLHSKVPSML